MVYKCKICGGQTTVDVKSGIAICDYCGTKQALPLFTEDSARLLYDRGNNYLLHNEYDKAEGVFNQLLTITPNDPELYWDLVLCKYGVTYVCDPKTEKYIPTCNRTHYTPIFSDENYRKAIELSSGEKLALYKADAETIDGIQKGILAVSKKEKPFDIFISYKETDASGNRTKDSVAAQRLYEKLTEAGYKVFFSRVTLEDKIGTQYEPYIYAALHSSKVMLTISSSKENIEAAWVKNEWSRFLLLRQGDSSKTLLPLYFDMEKEELPEEFALLSAYDMHTDGFEDELLRGIKKLISLPIMKAKRRKKILKATGIVAASLIVVAGIAAAIVIPKELEERRIAEEEAARASEAAALEKANEDAYQVAMTLFDNADYTAAETAFIALGDYKDSAHMAARCPIQPEYDAAMQLYYDGKYAQATWAFEALGDYEDAPEQKEKAELSWRISVASVVGCTYNSFLGMLEEEYCISLNGNIDTSAKYPGKAHLGIEFNAHGSVTSIAGDADSLYALYEDGYVANSQKNTTVEKDWEDVTQLVGELGSAYASLALKNDGTILIAQTDAMIEVEDWIKPAAQWTDIVSLSCGVLSMYPDYYVLLGLDANGKVHMVENITENIEEGYLEEDNRFYVENLPAFISSLSNIKKIKASRGSGSLYVCALDYDGNVYIYDNGRTDIMKNTTYKDILGHEVYSLDSEGYEGVLLAIDEKDNLIDVSKNRTLIEDVSYISGEYIITKTGTVFRISLDKLTLEDSEIKTIVHNEWLLD